MTPLKVSGNLKDRVALPPPKGRGVLLEMGIYMYRGVPPTGGYAYEKKGLYLECVFFFLIQEEMDFLYLTIYHPTARVNS